MWQFSRVDNYIVCTMYVIFNPIITKGLKALDASTPKHDHGKGEHVASKGSRSLPVSAPANSNDNLRGEESETNAGGSTIGQTGGQLAESTEAGSSHSRPSGIQEEGYEGSMEKDHEPSDVISGEIDFSNTKKVC